MERAAFVSPANTVIETCNSYTTLALMVCTARNAPRKRHLWIENTRNTRSKAPENEWFRAPA